MLVMLCRKGVIDRERVVIEQARLNIYNGGGLLHIVTDDCSVHLRWEELRYLMDAMEGKRAEEREVDRDQRKEDRAAETEKRLHKNARWMVQVIVNDSLRKSEERRTPQKDAELAYEIAHAMQKAFEKTQGGFVKEVDVVAEPAVNTAMPPQRYACCGEWEGGLHAKSCPAEILRKFEGNIDPKTVVVFTWQTAEGPLELTVAEIENLKKVYGPVDVYDVLRKMEADMKTQAERLGKTHWASSRKWAREMIRLRLEDAKAV